MIAMAVETESERRAVLGRLRVLELQLEELNVTGRMRKKVIDAEIKSLRERLADLARVDQPAPDR